MDMVKVTNTFTFSKWPTWSTILFIL